MLGANLVGALLDGGPQLRDTLFVHSRQVTNFLLESGQVTGGTRNLHALGACVRRVSAWAPGNGIMGTLSGSTGANGRDLANVDTTYFAGHTTLLSACTPLTAAHPGTLDCDLGLGGYHVARRGRPVAPPRTVGPRLAPTVDQGSEASLDMLQAGRNQGAITVIQLPTAHRGG